MRTEAFAPSWRGFRGGQNEFLNTNFFNKGDKRSEIHITRIGWLFSGPDGLYRQESTPHPSQEGNIRVAFPKGGMVGKSVLEHGENKNTDYLTPY
jgi:hypothetical protein